MNKQELLNRIIEDKQALCRLLMEENEKKVKDFNEIHCQIEQNTELIKTIMTDIDDIKHFLPEKSE